MGLQKVTDGKSTSRTLWKQCNIYREANTVWIQIHQVNLSKCVYACGPWVFNPVSDGGVDDQAGAGEAKQDNTHPEYALGNPGSSYPVGEPMDAGILTVGLALGRHYLLQRHVYNQVALAKPEAKLVVERSTTRDNHKRPH